MLAHHVTDWSSTEQFLLALLGLGEFESVQSLSSALPGRNLQFAALTRSVARCLCDQDFPTTEIEAFLSDELFSEEGLQQIRRLLPLLKGGATGTRPPLSDCILCDVAFCNWSDAGRDRFVVLHRESRGFDVERYFQDRSIHRPTVSQIREHFTPQERLRIESTSDLEEWLEARLLDNENVKSDFIRRKWEVYLNGWASLELLDPKPQMTPLLSEAVRILREDPSLYFANGPASSFGLPIPFGDRLAHMLRCWLGSRPN